MIPIAKVKKELLYSQNLKDVIDILKLISSSEFGRLSANKPKKDMLREELIACFGLLRNIFTKNIFLAERNDLPDAYLLVCSDEGFLGEVNNRVVKVVLSKELKKNTKFIVLGDRGSKMLNDAGIDCDTFPGIDNDVKTENAANIIKHIVTLYKKREIGAFYVVYMQFKSFIAHNTEIAKLLPCDEIVNYLETEKQVKDMLVEPHPYYVIEYLVKLWLENSLYNIFWSSKLSEWAVRVIQLEHSSDELKDITTDLKFKYFKSVHALNDKVIREIFAARAMK